MDKNNLEKFARPALMLLVFVVLFNKLIPFLLIILIGYILFRVFNGLPIVPIQYQNYVPIQLSFLTKKINFNKKNMDMETLKVKGSGSPKKFAMYIVLFVIAIGLALNSFVIVGAGKTGVQVLFGDVRDEEFASGFHIKNPFVMVNQMNIRTQEYTMSIAQTEGKKIGDDSIAALTKEGLQVELDITILFHLIDDKASDVYREIGTGYEEVVIRPQIRSTIREIIAQYEAKDIYSEKRQEASQKILESIKSTIEPRGIFVEEVLLRNINLPANLANSIQEKLQAEQEAQRYEFVLQKEEKEEERKRVEAAGQRDSQQIINESLTPRYLQYLYIQSLKDREGTIYVPTDPSNGTPLFRSI